MPSIPNGSKIRRVTKSGQGVPETASTTEPATAYMMF